MSQQKGEAVVAEPFSEDEIADYLGRYPDFFERHPALLMELKVAHQPGGVAVSLVERQVGMLRQRNSELERRLKELVAVAKFNDTVVEKIHQLSLTLMETSSPVERLEKLETCLREDFQAERAVLVLFRTPENQTLRDNGFLMVVAREDPGLKPFASFLKSGRPRCGLIRERQKTFLFAHNAAEISSAALVPLGENAELGFIVIGSRDADYFHPGKGMELLSRLGELASVALVNRPVRTAVSGPRASGS